MPRRSYLCGRSPSRYHGPVSVMPSYRYRAMTQAGKLVEGSLSAGSAAEVAQRIEYLGPVPIETVVEEGVAALQGLSFSSFSRATAKDVTIFTRDLALLLKAGTRISDALELLAQDIDVGRLRPTVGK